MTSIAAPATSGAKYRVLGINDDESSCCCCGRQGLKRVVWLQPVDESGRDSGSPVHFGTVCGARAAGWGYGGDAARIRRRVIAEEKATRNYYSGECARIVQDLERRGSVARARVAIGFDWQSATHNYGTIFVLPGDRICDISDPVMQTEEIKHAKARLRERFPVFLAFDGPMSAAQLRKLTA